MFKQKCTCTKTIYTINKKRGTCGTIYVKPLIHMTLASTTFLFLRGTDVVLVVLLQPFLSKVKT